MPPYALRHPALVVGVAAALGTATVAPVAAAASTATPAPVVQNQDLGGLFGGILGSVNGLSGSIATTVDQLVAGTLPGVLPPGTISSLVATLTSASTTALTEIVDLLSPAQISQIVQQGPGASVQLLNGLLASVTKLTTSLAAGTAQLPDVGTTLDRLTSVLAAGIPSGADALKTFVGLLDQVSTQLGLPKVASLPAVGPLITKLIGLAGQVTDPAALTAIVGTVTAAARGLGLDSSKLAALADAGAAAAAPVAAAVSVARARVGSVAVGSTRRSVRFKVVCPTTAPATGCVVKPSVKLAGSAASVQKSITVARGTTKTVSAAIPAAIAKKVQKSGGRLVVKVATTGATAGAFSKTIAVPAG